MSETYRFSDCGIVGMCEQCDHKRLNQHNLNALLGRPNEDGMAAHDGQYDFQRQPCEACIALSGRIDTGARKPFWRQAADAVRWTSTASGRQIEGSDTE